VDKEIETELEEKEQELLVIQRDNNMLTFKEYICIYGKIIQTEIYKKVHRRSPGL
jgi:hypothetical protein